MFTKILFTLLLLLFLHRESGTLCSDNDSCTGTKTAPDMCENGICFPGAPVCPLYSKPTTVLNKISGELTITNDEKWEYLIWKSESAFAASKIYLFVGNLMIPKLFLSNSPQLMPKRSKLELVLTC